jgi:hypothetical protein
MISEIVNKGAKKMPESSLTPENVTDETGGLNAEAKRDAISSERDKAAKRPKISITTGGVTNVAALLNASVDVFDIFSKQNATLLERSAAITNLLAAITAFGAKFPLLAKISGVAAIVGGAADANANLALLKKALPGSVDETSAALGLVSDGAAMVAGVATYKGWPAIATLATMLSVAVAGARKAVDKDWFGIADAIKANGVPFIKCDDPNGVTYKTRRDGGITRMALPGFRGVGNRRPAAAIGLMRVRGMAIVSAHIG